MVVSEKQSELFKIGSGKQMEQRIKKVAKILTQYCLQIKENEYVRIEGSSVSKDLILALEECILQAGAYPLPQVSLPGEQYLFYKNATDKQLKHFPDLEMDEIRKINACIYIRDGINLRETSEIESSKIAMRKRVRQPIWDFVKNPESGIKWCVTMFPTNAYAELLGLPLDQFEKLVYAALFLDSRDPIKKWNELSERQLDLVEALSMGKRVRIVGRETDLSMIIEGRTGINCDGRYNMPDGEVFTSPVEDSVNGVICFESYPTFYGGKEVRGVRLEFRDGEVIKASATKNENHLLTLLNTDEGSKRIGELGIGTNFGMKDRIGENLFDEKIAGTIHIALGSGYIEAGGINNSAIHWDMIASLKDLSLFIDEKKLIINKRRLTLA